MINNMHTAYNAKINERLKLNNNMYGSHNHNIKSFTDRTGIKVTNKYHNSDRARMTDVIYIGRGSAMGNPYSHLKSQHEVILVRDRYEAVRYFHMTKEAEINLYLNTGTMTDWVFNFINLLNKSLDNINKGIYTELECFCKPQICHGDAITNLMNIYGLIILAKYRKGP